jgi:hypothetical protein
MTCHIELCLLVLRGFGGVFARMKFLVWLRSFGDAVVLLVVLFDYNAFLMPVEDIAFCFQLCFASVIGFFSVSWVVVIQEYEISLPCL